MWVDLAREYAPGECSLVCGLHPDAGVGEGLSPRRSTRCLKTRVFASDGCFRCARPSPAANLYLGLGSSLDDVNDKLPGTEELQLVTLPKPGANVSTNGQGGRAFPPTLPKESLSAFFLGRPISHFSFFVFL